MGSRKSSFARGGGFLNGVDATIVNYEFTDAFAGVPFTPGRIRDLTGKMVDKPHSLNCLLTVRVDGAEEDTSATLRVASNFDDWTIDDDGHTLTPVDGARLGSSSAFGKFIQSWEAVSEEGAESDEYPEGSFNFTPIINKRVRLVQREYTAEEIANVKRLGATEKRKGKDGKEYSRQSLVVEQFYGEAETQPVGKKTAVAARPTPAAAGRQTTTTISRSKISKPNGKVPTDVDDLETLATEALLEIINAAGGKIAKTKLSLKTLTTPLLKGNDRRDDVRKLIFSDDFLASVEGVSYDKATGTVELTE